MDLGLFLPKIYHLVRQNYVISGQNFNQFINAYNASLQKSMILGISGFIAIIIAIAILFKVHNMNHVKRAQSAFKQLVIGYISFIIGVGMVVMGALSMPFRQKASTTDFGNGFQVKQTSFIIQPNEKSFQANDSRYIFDNQENSMPTSSKNYAVYARVYNSSSHNYYNYLIGNMVDGNFETITTTQEKHYWSNRTTFSGVHYIRDDDYDRLIKNEQLKTLATYIEFIKKHHLEDNFKDNVKLIMSNKFYDKKYKSQLVMKGKDGRILYMKHNINKNDIANVGITR